jgi:creatinine amidohydrolase
MSHRVANNMTRRMPLRCLGAGAATGLTASCGDSANQPGTPTSPATESATRGADERWVKAPTATTNIHRLEEMNTTQLGALPRDRTVVIIPGAYKGEHGPYLPNVDSFRNERLAHELANAIAQRPGWHVVMFPFIPLGQGGANEFGNKASFNGTFVVRIATLRAIFMDLADHLGEQGFRWVFVVHHHGSPYQLHALDEAGDYFSDSYGGRQEDASSGHAGMRETSEALYLRPDLVDPAYKQAPVLAAQTFEELIRIASKNDWPGYLGSPRLATASLGEQALKEYSARLNTLALEILDGRDYRRMTRAADEAVTRRIPSPRQYRATSKRSSKGRRSGCSVTIDRERT